ncbi:MAG: endonuclease/exonuclease/phosphatase family protein, partial [Myxococcota bacterium]
MEHARGIAGVVGGVLAGVVLVATLLPLSRVPAWWVRVFDFPRLQAAVLGLVAAVLLVVGHAAAPWALVLAAATTGCVVRQLVAIWPFTPVAGVEVERAHRPTSPGVRLLISNVLQTNRRADLLLAQIAATRPDLVLAMETDAWWAEALAPLHADYPHRVAAPLPNTYGMILYARLPLEDAAVRYLVEPDVPSVHATLRLPDGARVRLHGLHPRPPAPGQDSAARDAELVVVGRLLR